MIFSLVCKRKFLYGKIPYACSVKLTDLILECQDHFYILNKKAGCVVTLLSENRLSVQFNFKRRIKTCFFFSAIFMDILVARPSFVPNICNASGKNVFSSINCMLHFSANFLLSLIPKCIIAVAFPVRLINQFVNFNPLSLVASKSSSPFGNASPQDFINDMISYSWKY